MVVLELGKHEYAQPLDVVDRGSETQLKMVANLNQDTVCVCLTL